MFQSKIKSFRNRKNLQSGSASPASGRNTPVPSTITATTTMEDSKTNQVTSVNALGNGTEKLAER